MNKKISQLFLVLIFVVSIFTPIIKQPTKAIAVEDLLQKTLQEKEAIIWHLGHAGYAIRTKNTFLIFDYIRGGRGAGNLVDGIINPREIKDQNVYVFVSHTHADHYDPGILEWEKVIPNIHYIFGWDYYKKPPTEYSIKPGDSLILDEMEIHTVEAIDLGSAFLVKVDNLAIYHSGDHVLWGDAKEVHEYLHDSLMYLLSKTNTIDIMMMGIREDSEKEFINQGTADSIQLMKPSIFFPMHESDYFNSYKNFKTNFEKDLPRTTLYAPYSFGFSVEYKGVKVSATRNSVDFTKIYLDSPEAVEANITIENQESKDLIGQIKQFPSFLNKIESELKIPKENKTVLKISIDKSKLKENQKGMEIIEIWIEKRTIQIQVFYAALLFPTIPKIKADHFVQIPFPDQTLDVVIQNIGKAPLILKMKAGFSIKVTPDQEIKIEPGSQQTLTIQVLPSVPLSSMKPSSTLKKKFSEIVLSTNDPESPVWRIKVTYFDV